MQWNHLHKHFDRVFLFLFWGGGGGGVGGVRVKRQALL